MSQINTDLRQRADEIVAGLKKRSLNAAIKRIAKGKDHWAKKDAIARFCQWNEQVPVLWAMLRAGHLEVDDVQLWEALSQDVTTIDHEDVIKLLSGIASVDHFLNSSVPNWSGDLDRIISAVYTRDPAPLVAAMEGFSPDVKRGVATLRLRFGDISREDLPHDAAWWAKALAQMHLKHYGIGVNAGSAKGAHRYVIWPARGHDDEKYGLDLWVPDTNRPSVRFYDYLTLFTTLEAWRAAVLALASQQDYGLSLPLALDAFAVADVPTLAKCLKAMSDPDVSAWEVLEHVRTDLGPAELGALTEALDGLGKDRIADIATALTIKKLSAAGEPISPGLMERLNFSGYESGYGSGYGKFFEARERYQEVLELLPRDVVRAKLIQQLTKAPYYRERALPFVAAFVDDDPKDPLWEAALDCLGHQASKHTALTHWMLAAKGVALLTKVHGVEGMDRLAAAWDRLTQERSDGKAGIQMRNGLGWALIEALLNLAKDGVAWPERHDRFLRYNLWGAGHDGYDYHHYISEPLEQALKGLPEDRLIAVFKRGLDPAQNPGFNRPFGSMRGDHIPDIVIQMGLQRLVTDGDKIRHPYHNWMKYLPHSDWLGERIDPFLKMAVRQGLPALIASAFKDSTGQERWEAIERAAAGPDPKSQTQTLPEEPIARLQALCEQVLDQNPGLKTSIIYGMRRLDDEVPGPDTINRTGGLPIGVTRKTWPRDDDGLFMHAITLDLTQMGHERPTKGRFKKARALALFVKNLDDNEAWEPYNDWVKVLALTDKEIAQGVPDVDGWELWEERADADDDPGNVVEIVAVPIPQNMGDTVAQNTRDAIHKLAGGLPGDIGDYPNYIQDDPWMDMGYDDEDFEDDEDNESGALDEPGEYVFQFDERLVYMNLGDMGMMYVFTNTAFWQCY